MKVKVLLKEDVADLGKKNTIQKVKMGYAKNYLIPQGLAELATSEVQKRRKEQKKHEAVSAKKAEEKARKLADRIGNIKVVFERKLTKTGKIFGSIKAEDISSHLEKQDIDLDPDKIELEEPIKQTGGYDVLIDLDLDENPHLKVVVKEKRD